MTIPDSVNFLMRRAGFAGPAMVLAGAILEDGELKKAA
jgi:hypothetical protein